MSYQAMAAGLMIGVTAATCAQPPVRVTEQEEAFGRARSNAVRVEELLERARRVLHGWLRHADPKTLLLPDYLPSFSSEGGRRPLLYTPHNSGADNYPYLIVTSWFTDRALYEGRIRLVRLTCPTVLFVAP